VKARGPKRISLEFDEHWFCRRSIPKGTMAAWTDYFGMKRIGRDHFNERAPDEPLPSKMEELLLRLTEHDQTRDDAAN
jgi:hypothetical protein